ncbi:fungal-specific transcription factor domain-containing protein [Talaromyces proteolyticus]|uniref:Fungal-specific transcription factor domain-containing protein n=1 Tax=Talaromyces proteolyticus TaxID=1131652 RepID=A0AAD4Q2U3_9EURO|nr:fungal-specific transcription factor domain-containing protein [Talaromyces proteolyticus]KAH8700747.1 fungal-specific transcription factor domain-containing protein [Talaromyces proteolyticus]
MTRNRIEESVPRQRVACRRCNTKKIKCNASGETACNNCLASNTECILINSQRGRYTRRHTRTRAANVPTLSQQQKASIAVDARPTGSKVHSPILPSYQPQVRSPQVGSDGSTSVADRDPNGAFYLHIADQTVNPTNNQRITDKVRTLFLGESFSLTYVVHDVLSPFLSNAPRYKKRLHFPIGEGYDPSVVGQHDIVQNQRILLQERNLLYQLEPSTLERLLGVFFRWFNPAFPILNPSECMQNCRQNEMSLLVLNAVLMVTVTICDDEELALTRLENRHQARAVFYHQAKTLFDSDMEPDKINSVIAVFFLSFWWGGPNDEKDSWYWLGIAIGLAQSLGMHRSTARSHMSERTARQWRRIWWSLRVRDVLTSGSIGRPQHFSERDCDVEMLELEDIYDIYTEEDSEQAHYAHQIARLSIIFSNIIVSRYAARHADSLSQKINLEKALDNFREQIPRPLQYSGINPDSKKGLWSAMLLMAFNFGVILLSRPPRSIDIDTVINPESWGNHLMAQSASNEVTRLMEDLLSAGMGRLCQIHTIPALFNALAMHVFSICMSGAIGRELAENRARTCMLGLRCLQESWPVSGWILKLWVDIMERLKAKLSCTPASSDIVPHSAYRGRDVVGDFTTQQLRTQLNSNGSPVSPSLPTTAAPPINGGFDDMGTFRSNNTRLNPWVLPNNDYTPGQDQLLPNMFVLDCFSQDPVAEQLSFFDSLNVPDWDNI